MELVVRIAGAAGQGVQSMGEILARTAFRHGLFVHGELSYHSRIRGGENAFTLRLSEGEVLASRAAAEALVALNEEMLAQYLPILAPDGIVLCDEAIPPTECAGLRIPAQRLAGEQVKSPIAANTVLLGALARLLGLDLGIMQKVVEETFRDKAEPNVRALALGYAAGRPGPWKLPSTAFQPGERMLLTGGQAIGAGAIAAGCRFLSAYPMTPGTPVMEFLAAHSERYGIVVEQAEDEIAAINMALGASYAGVRSMVTTSGGGFALMVEGLSLAGMIETPVVIHLGQRPGPATGLPTRTSQENLLFVLHAGHGEFPRYVAAPATAEDAFYLTMKAFELAEKYQVPAFLLTDQHLVDSFWTVPPLDPSRVPIRNHLLTPEELAKLTHYNRFEFTPSGVSPRAIPGSSEKLVLVDSDEHDPYGRITEDLELRKRMVEKRLRKGEGLAKELDPPRVFPSGSLEGKTVFLGWGSSYGAIREAVAALMAQGKSVAMVHLTEVWPLWPSLGGLLGQAERVIAVEGNATAQLGRLLAQETGIRVHGAILRYDGRPFLAEDVLKAMT